MSTTATRLAGLHPTLRPLAEALLARCKAAGYDVRIAQGYRSAKEQNDLYAQGRTAPGPKVTNARAKDSRHCDTLPDGRPGATAFDIAVYVNGAADWNVKNPAWLAAGKIGEELGLQWGGRWTKFVDRPHFQLPKRP